MNHIAYFEFYSQIEFCMYNFCDSLETFHVYVRTLLQYRSKIFTIDPIHQCTIHFIREYILLQFCIYNNEFSIFVFTSDLSDKYFLSRNCWCKWSWWTKATWYFNSGILGQLRMVCRCSRLLCWFIVGYVINLHIRICLNTYVDIVCVKARWY